MYNSLFSQCFVSWGSTNYTALWVTGYFGDLSAVLVVDELQRQAVDRRCCKRPSRLRSWSVRTPPTFTRRTASELITVHRPKPLLPSTGPFQESSILHILDTQRVYSVSLTTDSADRCSLLQEYHRISLTGFGAIVVFSAARASGTLVGPEQEQQLGISTQSSSALFWFFSDPTTQLGSAIQGPNTDSDRCLVFQHRDRDSGSSFIYYIFQHRLQRVCLLVCLFVCLFCLSVQVCLFLCFFVFYSAATETRVRHLSTIRCRNRCALALSGRHGERGVQ